MKTFLILFVALLPACVFAQTGNLPTIKNPKDRDRLETKTRWFPAAFRLDTLKSYFIAEANDSLAVHRVDIDANAGAINALEGQNDGVVTSGLVTGSASKILSLTRSAPLSVLEVDFTDLVNDADSDPTNEIQTLQEVTDEGATTTADITANSFTGDGSALTDVDAEKLGNEDPSFYEDQNMTYDNSTGVLSLEGSEGVELDDEFYPRGKAVWLYNDRSKNNIIIPELQNFLYSADTWATVTATGQSSTSVGRLFDGDSETRLTWNSGEDVEIKIDLDGKGRMSNLTYSRRYDCYNN